jgi:NAD(P)H-flavin reductase/ferredoxin
MNFNGKDFSVEPDESVLDLLIRHKQDISFSCRTGSCQSCLVKLNAGNINAKAQQGLKDSLVAQQCFFACQQKAADIVSACHIDNHALFASAQLIEKHFFTHDICRLRLLPSCPLFYHAGQFINLKSPQGTIRSYSIASLPSEDAYIELHIRRKSDGVLSNWLFDSFQPGDFIDIQGPIGKCFYANPDRDKNLVLIGNGTGAAPLIGIARDAILSGHQGKIHFYHGAYNADSLYLHDELVAKEKSQRNFFYHACVSGEAVSEGYISGACHEIALAQLNNAKNTLLYVCGNPEMVSATQKKAFLLGIPLKQIYIDPFEYQDLRKKDR